MHRILPIAFLTMLLAALSLAPAHGAKPDPGFGDRGYVVEHLGPPPVRDVVRHIAVDSQNRIVAMVSESVPGTSQARIVVARYLDDGTRDTSFGENGVRVAYESGGGNGFLGPGGLALDPDGRILVSGHSEFFPTAQRIDLVPFAARLTEAGDLDPTFGEGGVRELPGLIPGGKYRYTTGLGNEVGTDRSGRVLLSGVDYPAGEAIRLTDSGNVDASYGEGGFAHGLGGYPGAGGAAATQGVSAVMRDGSVLFAGFTSKDRLLLTKVTKDGTIDRRYGKESAFGDATIRPTSIVADERGGFLLGATTGGLLRTGKRTKSGVPNAIVFRLDRTGQLDRSFGTRGYAALRGFGKVSERDDRVLVSVDFKGRILAAANPDEGYYENPDLAVARLSAAGKPDRRFGKRGFIELDLDGNSEHVTSLATGQGGRPLLGGQLVVKALLLRIRP